MNQKKILVIEDDLNLGFLLLDYLESENLKVKLCKDGSSGLAELGRQEYDLCLLDVMMPKVDGFSVARTMLNKGHNVPFIFLTAKSMKEDKLEGYSIGAEDYITKPFDEEELLCKINVILRRNSKEDTDPTKFKIGKFDFDYDRLELKYDEKIQRLTEKENAVLRLLCIYKNRILKREIAVQRIYGKQDYFLGRSFDVYIYRLRKLLACDPSIEIQNIFKVGFMLAVKD